VTETPGKTAPVESATLPVSVALLTCPKDVALKNADTIIHQTIFFIFLSNL